jgi:hypothetical protein
MTTKIIGCQPRDFVVSLNAVERQTNRSSKKSCQTGRDEAVRFRICSECNGVQMALDVVYNEVLLGKYVIRQ